MDCEVKLDPDDRGNTRSGLEVTLHFRSGKRWMLPSDNAGWAHFRDLPETDDDPQEPRVFSGPEEQVAAVWGVYLSDGGVSKEHSVFLMAA